jgi:hypothetical protein
MDLPDREKERAHQNMEGRARRRNGISSHGLLKKNGSEGIILHFPIFLF